MKNILTLAISQRYRHDQFVACHRDLKRQTLLELVDYVNTPAG